MANLTLRSVKGSALTHSELDGNFEYFTGSIDAINAGTGSFLTSADTASFITSADTGSFLTSEDTGSFVTSAQTASLNISDTKYTVNTALSASGTTQSTTSICTYGVNVFEYVTTTHQATKLPQPVTGKSVRIVNNSNSILRVFPSNIGGHINNYPIDTPALIPPDGNLYEFICVENPLPGAWTFSAPATAQYDSGEMELSITALSEDGYNPWVTGWDSTHAGIISGAPTGDFRINFKNFPPLVYRTAGGYTHTGYSPSTPWKGISKIKVYTNLIGTQSLYTYLILKGIGTEQLYTLTDPLQYLSYRRMVSDSLYEMQLGKRISGTAVTGSTAYTSANIGDAGTVWDEISFGTTFNTDGAVSDYGTLVGYKTLDPAYPLPNERTYTDKDGNEITLPQGTPVEIAYGSSISFYMRPFLDDFNYGTIPDFKFRFIIEYYQ